MMLWGHKILKQKGNSIAEKVLSILCHIFKGEATIREKLHKPGDKKQPGESDDKAGSSGTTLASSSSVAASVAQSLIERTQRSIPVSPAYVQQV